MLEYHIFTEMNERYQQAYVFVVDRDESKVSVRDMYTVMVQSQPGEVKTRINLENIQQAIISTPGGNIHTKDAKSIFEIFGDLIPMDVRIDHAEQELKKLKEQSDTEVLLRAAEAAMSAHPLPFDKDGYFINPDDPHKQ